MTAADLAARMARFGLTATPDGAAIEYDAGCPAALDRAAAVLTTGLLSALTGRRWLGCEGATGAVVVLRPAALVPPQVTLLAVEGGTAWDRVFTATRRDHPALFAGPPPPPEPPPRRDPPAPNRPGGLTDLLLAHLRRDAAAGDAAAGRTLAGLVAYLAACDRGEIELPETPASVAAREWNAALREIARQKAAGPERARPRPRADRNTPTRREIAWPA